MCDELNGHLKLIVLGSRQIKKITKVFVLNESIKMVFVKRV